MRASTVRLSERTWELVRKEAEAQGVSANAWVAEAVLGRLVHTMTRRGDQMALDFARIYDAIEELRDP